MSHGGFGSASQASSFGGGVLVVVHPAGRLDDVGAATYWTEVPAFPACPAEGATVEEALQRTRAAIVGWLARREGGPRPAGDIPLRVELAF